MARCREKEGRVRADIEWVPRQVVERLVHEVNP
jgi:hypothetical protein